MDYTIVKDDLRYPTKSVSECMCEELTHTKKEYIKVYCSNCLDGEIIYKKDHSGFYCNNINCIYYLRKVYIREV
jgi:hypothetical protein